MVIRHRSHFENLPAAVCHGTVILDGWLSLADCATTGDPSPCDLNFKSVSTGQSEGASHPRSTCIICYRVHNIDMRYIMAPHSVYPHVTTVPYALGTVITRDDTLVIRLSLHSARIKRMVYVHSVHARSLIDTRNGAGRTLCRTTLSPSYCPVPVPRILSNQVSLVNEYKNGTLRTPQANDPSSTFIICYMGHSPFEFHH